MKALLTNIKTLACELTEIFLGEFSGTIYAVELGGEVAAIAANF